MRRTELRRGKPLSRSAPMRRRGGVRKRNARRFKQRHEAAFGEQAERCRRSMCVACVRLGTKQTTRTVPHHVVHRPEGTDADTIPLCRDHHTDGPMSVHGKGRETFWAFVGVDEDDVLQLMRTPGYILDSFYWDGNDDDLPVSPLLLWLDGP